MKPGSLLQDAYRNAEFSALLSFVDHTGAEITLTDYDSVEARYFEKQDQDTANAVVVACTVTNNAVSWTLSPAQTLAFHNKLVYFELWFLKAGLPDDVKVNGRLIVWNVPDAAEATGAATVIVNDITQTTVVTNFIGAITTQQVQEIVTSMFLDSSILESLLDAEDDTMVPLISPDGTIIRVPLDLLLANLPVPDLNIYYNGAQLFYDNQPLLLDESEEEQIPRAILYDGAQITYDNKPLLI